VILPSALIIEVLEYLIIPYQYSQMFFYFYRQLQMMLSMLQMNPGLIQALGRGFLALNSELERMEKRKDLEVY
jgi:hypothetical protein